MHAQADGSTPIEGYRLSGAARPTRYQLEMAPDIAEHCFEATVTIELELSHDSDEITLHALDLEFEEVLLECADGVTRTGRATSDADSETARLSFDSVAPRGSAELTIRYGGEFCERLVGMYSSTFTVGETEAEVVVTQCESTHARRFLPCFDEPEFKASFSVALVVPDDLTAVSNAAELSREPAGDSMVRVSFADTMLMSTYLLAIVVGPLEVTEPRIVRGRDGDIPLRVVFPAGSAHLCEFALDVAEAALAFFEDWYDIAYPGDKLDLVAVPDFAFGAMENLGCVTFREVLLLVDPDTATPQELQRVADVINHEIAHMWFGNLVTMKWWNGIWLNEAFATFMEVSASDSFRPEWDVWTTFGLARAAAFETDALRSTRPIEFEVVTAADAEAMFDILTYEKGCSVLRMLEAYLGADVFRAGIRKYLRDNAYSNTETTDLWDALEAASGEPVRRIMDAWIYTGGHPLISVEPAGSVVWLDQHLALANPPDGAREQAHRFPIPMVIRCDSATNSRNVPLLLEEPTTWKPPPETERIQPNAGGSGFFRTLMDRSSRHALTESDATPLERFVLVDDTWFAMRSGHIEMPDALHTVSSVVDAGEDDPSVWRRISAACSDLVRLGGAANQLASRTWIVENLGDRMRHLGTSSAHTGRPAEVAGTLLATMGNAAADQGALNRAREIFAAPSADPALTAGALDVVARHCDAAEHAEIERRWREANTPQEEQRHLSALVATADPELMLRAFALVDSDVRSQDAPYVYRRALSNPTLGALAWTHVCASWDDMLQRFPSGSVPRMIEGIRTFADPGLAGEVETFLAEHQFGSEPRQITQHIEAMGATVAAAARVQESAARSQAGASQRPW
ncbi:MAG: M1 family metallopeptidase [Microthrixaceae bacterium]